MKPPIIIIGAGRSGTKILRDSLCLHSDLVTWPCDEINPVWRYNNAGYPTDELKPKYATSKVKEYIRSKFKELSKKNKGKRVVEKTCANSLRVPYVYKIFPEAKFIFLVRDGRDVAESARRRWRGGFEMDYMFEKAKMVPFSDISYYLFQFLSNRLYQLLNKKGRLKTWGPCFSDIDKIVQEKSLIKVAGIQWRECVRRAKEGFEEVPSSQVYKIKYEEVVKEPQRSLKEIFDFFDVKINKQFLRKVSSKITDENIGKWKRNLSKSEIDQLMSEIKDLMVQLNYISNE